MPANPRAKLVQTKLYIFDLDGTLIDSSIDIANAVNTSLSELGLPTLAVEKIKTFVGTGTRLLMQQALEGRDEIFPHAFKLFSKHYGEHLLDHTRLYPEALDLITSLRSKKLAILSNKRQAFCDPIVKGLGLTPFFEMVVGGDKLAKKKPDPEPILYICTALNISPSDAVMIGDSPIDVEAGKAAGCLTVGIEKGFCKPSDVAASQPDFLIHTLANFKDLQDR